MKRRIQDIIDMSRFQSIMDRLNAIYPFPSAIIDNDGVILTATAWQDVCTKFHRKNKECEKACIKSDKYIADHLDEANPAVSYRCPHGLTDNAMPIIIDGEHLATFFTGQFFMEKPDLEFFKAQAAKYGFDETAYLEAVQRVPIWNAEQLNSYLYFIKEVIEIISGTALKTLNEIEANKALEKSEEKFKALFEQAGDYIILLELIENKGLFINDANQAACEIHGYTREEMLTKSIADLDRSLNKKQIEVIIKKVMAGETAIFETLHEKKDGTIFPIEVSAKLLESKPDRTLIISIERDITGRKQMENKAIMLQTAIEQVPVGIALADKNLELFFCNAAGLGMRGEKEKQLVHIPKEAFKNWQVLRPNGEPYEVEDLPLVRAVTQGKTVNENFIVKAEDGAEHLCDATAVPVYDANGENAGGIVIFPDITQRKEMEDELANLEKKQRVMIENIADVIAILDQDGVIRYKSPNIERHFGWDPQDLVGVSGWETVHPDDLEWIKKEFYKILQKENATVTLEYRYKCKDNSYTWIELTAKNLLHDPDINGVLLNYHDISERKKSDETIQLLVENTMGATGQELYDEITSHLCDWLKVDCAIIGQIEGDTITAYSMHLDGKFIKKYSYTLSGAPCSHAVKKGYCSYTENICKLFPEDKDLVDMGAEGYVGVALKNKQDESIGVLCAISRNKLDLPVQTENIMKTLATRASSEIMREQDEEKIARIEKQLARAERMKSLGVLAGGVAHDLNNILGPVVMLPELIKDDIEDANWEGAESKEQVIESLDIIQSSSQRASTVVRDLVALSRGGGYDRVPFNINSLPALNNDLSLQDLKESNPKVSYKINISKEKLIILASCDHLLRVIQNLIRNAAEAIKGKGKISVTTSSKSLKNDYRGYAIIPAGDYAVIEISDTGHGIAEEHLSNIFEPFFTKKKKSERSGSGLGLSVVHGIIEEHNGFIDVISKVDKGTTFSIYLPLIKDSAKDTEEGKKESIVGGSECILIVDDEPGQRFLARKSLEKLGYTVDDAEEGHEALELFKQAKKDAQASPFDLVVLDMIMEDGFDGLDTLNEILKLYPEQKVVIASGHAGNDRSQAAQNLGADWLAKPYDIENMAMAVRKLLDKKP